MINNVLLLIAVLYSICLCIHTICVFISYHQCKQYEVIIRHFKRSLYSNKHFSNHIRMINQKEVKHQDDDQSDDDQLDDQDEDELDAEDGYVQTEDDGLTTNTSKYWLTSYFTLIIILIFVIPNSVHLLHYLLCIIVIYEL